MGATDAITIGLNQVARPDCLLNDVLPVLNDTLASLQRPCRDILSSSSTGFLHELAKEMPKLPRSGTRRWCPPQLILPLSNYFVELCDLIYKPIADMHGVKPAHIAET